MIKVEEDFSGSIDSKTYDTRISLSFIHPHYTNLSIGVNLIHVRWKTLLYRTGGPDDSAQELELKYNTFDLGLLYHLTEAINLGLMLKNLYGVSSKKDDNLLLPRYAIKLTKKSSVTADSAF